MYDANEDDGQRHDANEDDGQRRTLGGPPGLTFDQASTISRASRVARTSSRCSTRRSRDPRLEGHLPEHDTEIAPLDEQRRHVRLVRRVVTARAQEPLEVRDELARQRAHRSGAQRA